MIVDEERIATNMQFAVELSEATEEGHMVVYRKVDCLIVSKNKMLEDSKRKYSSFKMVFLRNNALR